MKKVLTLALALCLVLGLCGCNGDGGSETTASTTAPVETTAATTAPVETTVPQGGYTVKVVDEGGNPIAGALVQLCKDSCLPAPTDDNGVAVWPKAEITDGYKVSFVKLPAGYAYVDETVTDFYFAAGETEMTIILKAAA